MISDYLNYGLIRKHVHWHDFYVLISLPLGGLKTLQINLTSLDYCNMFNKIQCLEFKRI